MHETQERNRKILNKVQSVDYFLYVVVSKLNCREKYSYLWSKTMLQFKILSFYFELIKNVKETSGTLPAGYQNMCLNYNYLRKDINIFKVQNTVVVHLVILEHSIKGDEIP